jgi:SAM-dependent methyltransferase
MRVTLTPVGLTVKRSIQSLRLRLADAADAALGRRDAFTPPRRLDFVGDSDFQATGEEFARHFRELAGLQASDRVLDIGCGIGRMARVLVPVLCPPGSYDGFDVDARGISWCERRYGSAPAPFRFRHVDVRNARYNPGGAVSGTELAFPYPDASFDIALATSVFTHLLADVADHYLAETARVLSDGGRLFATWFLLGTEHPPAPNASFSFSPTPTGDAAWIADQALPESAVAYEVQWLRGRLRQHGLQLREPISYGSWSGGQGTSLQDIVVAEKVNARGR